MNTIYIGASGATTRGHDPIENRGQYVFLLPTKIFKGGRGKIFNSFAYKPLPFPPSKINELWKEKVRIQ